MLNQTVLLTSQEYSDTVANVAKMNKVGASKGLYGHIELTFNGYEVRDHKRYHSVTIIGQTPKFADFEFLARVDFIGENTVVTGYSDEYAINRDELDSKRCDHCNIRHARNVAYLVRNVVSGETLQVGSSCLADFTGHKGIVKWDYSELMDTLNGYGGSLNRNPEFEVTYIVALASAIIAKTGKFVRSGEFDSTVSYMRHLLYSREDKLGKADLAIFAAIPDHREYAAKVIEWIKAEHATNRNDYMDNLFSVVSAEYTTDRFLGILASAPASYFRAMERKAEKENRESKPKGEIISGKQTIIGKIISFKEEFTEYGETLKVLIEREDNTRVYGTLARAIDHAQVGNIVSFNVSNLKPSNRDSSFGFFSRPTKAQIIGSAE